MTEAYRITWIHEGKILSRDVIGERVRLEHIEDEPQLVVFGQSAGTQTQFINTAHPALASITEIPPDEYNVREVKRKSGGGGSTAVKCFGITNQGKRCSNDGKPYLCGKHKVAAIEFIDDYLALFTETPDADETVALFGKENRRQVLIAMYD